MSKHSFAPVMKKHPFVLAALALSASAPFAAHAAPTVSFSAPAAGATISQPINQSSQCEVSGLRIDRVAFSIRRSDTSAWTSLNSEENAPWQCNIDPSKLASGDYTLRAVARDSGGVSATATRSIKIGSGGTGGGTTNPAPTVSVTSPTGGQTVSGTSVSCAATADDSNGVTQVQFFLDSATTAFATATAAPYACSFDSTKLSNGSHTLKATATDSLGAKKTTQVSFNVSNGTSGGGTSPTVSFKAPASGQTLSGNLYQSSACEVTGSNVKIKSVKFSIDSTALNTEGSAPWQCNLDTRKFPNGVHTLKAAVTDTGNVVRNTQISVNIQNGTTPPSNVSPNVSIMKPDPNATISAPLNSTGCVADAADPDGTISRVDFVLSNGSTSKSVGSKTAAPYQCAINTAEFANGTYTLMAVATDNAGATSSAQRSLTISKTPSDDGGGSGGTSPIAAADIIMRASAEVPFTEQNGYTAQVINTYTSARSIPESGIHGSVLSNGESLRLGKVIEPDSGRKALAFHVTNSDPITSGGRRAELSVSPNIEMNRVYWIALSAYVYDWGTLTDADQSLFGIQMHSGNNSLNLSPSFGIYTTNKGRNFTVRTRWSTASSPTPSNSVKTDNATQPIPFGRWVDFVLKFKHNTSGGGFLQVWMDGNQIVNHVGNLGFNTPGYNDYAKFGYYNWGGSSMSSTARKVLLRSPTIVADPTGQTYSPEQVRTLVNASTASTSTSTSGTGTSTLGGGTTTTASAGDGGVCSTISCAAQ